MHINTTLKTPVFPVLCLGSAHFQRPNAVNAVCSMPRDVRKSPSLTDKESALREIGYSENIEMTPLTTIRIEMTGTLAVEAAAPLCGGAEGWATVRLATLFCTGNGSQKTNQLRI